MKKATKRISQAASSHHIPSPLRTLGRLSHSSMAVLGLVATLSMGFFLAQPDWRASSLSFAKDHGLSILSTDALPSLALEEVEDLDMAQASVTTWLSKKYRLAPSAVSSMVEQAYQQAARVQVSPHLILAVMAVESRFNPYAQASEGAKGLMQIPSEQAAMLEASRNIREGASGLQAVIAQAGDVQEGLKQYSNIEESAQATQYAQKVLLEQKRLELVAQGRMIPFTYMPTGSSMKS